VTRAQVEASRGEWISHHHREKRRQVNRPFQNVVTLLFQFSGEIHLPVLLKK
jgi:hypothetical protein